MEVDLRTLQRMHKLAADLVLADPVYVPIFERIEREIAALEGQGDAIDRARAIAARHKAVA